MKDPIRLEIKAGGQNQNAWGHTQGREFWLPGWGCSDPVGSFKGRLAWSMLLPQLGCGDFEVADIKVSVFSAAHSCGCCSGLPRHSLTSTPQLRHSGFQAMAVVRIPQCWGKLTTGCRQISSTKILRTPTSAPGKAHASGETTVHTLKRNLSN